MKTERATAGAGGVHRREILTFGVAGLCFLLGIFGVLTIAGSQFGGEKPLLLPLRQLLFLVIGGGVLAGCARVPFEWYRRSWPALGTLSVAALAALPVFGVRINGMYGWFRFGSFLVQPSEVTKGFFLLTLVMLRPRPGEPAGRSRRIWIAAAAWCGLILLQPDFGTGAIYLATFGAMLFLTGASWRQLAALAAAGIVGAGAFLIRHPYARRRIFCVLDPDADPLGAAWHVRQFVLTVARGGFWGNRIDGALWSGAYLPLPYNDSAFATLAETLGFVGVAVLFAMFTGLIVLLIRLTPRSETAAEERYFIQGCVLMIAIQSLVHVSVNLALLPPTGLTLPFISYGGSSMIGCGVMIGMALSAARSGRSPASAAELPPDADDGTMCADGAPADALH